MTLHYVFNGDADGLCSLQQLRLADDRPALLTTGVKRDIALLRRVHPRAGDEVVVLDVSHAENAKDVHRLLDQGAFVRYFDHHHAGTLPVDPRFEAHIDEGAELCTSLIVDRYLGGAWRPWAIVGAFGDGLGVEARAMCEAARIATHDADVLEDLGTRINYNAYGERREDLCIDPAELADEMSGHGNPVTFARSSASYARISAQYESDFRQARNIEPVLDVPGALMIALPPEGWARRVVGVLANELARERPDSAVALLAPVEGGYRASVRVPADSSVPADEFCREFPSGNGRKRAAGVNRLAERDVPDFAARFRERYGRTG